MATAKKNNRDDFTNKVKDELAKRVAYRCCMPGCDIVTLGPKLGGGYTNDGTAAHITAASPKGPRYDKSLSKEQRSSIDNGIWMCANHGRQIDSNKNKYSVSELREWKELAEETASSRLLKKQPTEEDATELLKQASKGLGSIFIPHAVRKTAEATHLALRELDPRLNIVASYIDGKTSYSINVIDGPVPLKMRVTTPVGIDFDAGMRRLMDDGEPLVLKDVKIEMKGSEAISAIMSEDLIGELILGPISKNAEIKIYLENKEKKRQIKLPTIKASLNIGAKKARVIGKLFDGAVNFSIDYFADVSSQSCQVTFGLCPDFWVGQDIRYLKDFHDVHEFFEKCAVGWSLYIQLMVDGRKYGKFGTSNVSDMTSVQEAFVLLDYLRYSMMILEEINAVVLFRNNFSVDQDQVMYLIDVAKMLSSRNRSAKGFRVNIKLDEKDNPNFDFHKFIDLPKIWYHNYPDKVNVLGVLVEVPDVEFEINDVKVRILKRDSDGVEASVEGTELSKFSISKNSPFNSDEVISRPSNIFVLPHF